MYGYVYNMKYSRTSHAYYEIICGFRRYTSCEYFGVMVDTGCATASRGGEEQYIAYCNHIRQRSSI